MSIFSKEMLFVPMYNLTVVTTPAEAVCTLTYDGNSYTSKTAKVKKGTVIGYSITHATYGTTTGIITMDSNKTLTCIGTSSPSYVDVAWTQPALTANGTLGLSKFAVASSDEYGTTFATWKAFDGKTGNSNTGCLGTHAYSVSNIYWTLWTSTAIKINSITVMNRTIDDTEFKEMEFYRGTNTYNWIKEGDYTNDVSTKNSTWSCSWGGSDYTKYHKLLVVSAGSSSNPAGTQEVTIDAVYQSETTTYSWETSIT